MLNYSLFTGQELFSNTEEVLAIKSQAFDEAFLFGENRKSNIVY